MARMRGKQPQQQERRCQHEAKLGKAVDRRQHREHIDRPQRHGSQQAAAKAQDGRCRIIQRREHRAEHRRQHRRHGTIGPAGLDPQQAAGENGERRRSARQRRKRDVAVKAGHGRARHRLPQIPGQRDVRSL